MRRDLFTAISHDLRTPLASVKAISEAIQHGVIEDPKEVGPDRIADAVGAYDLYGGPTIVVDFGTATTLDAISAKGEYLGGAICPGVTISADALFQRAARLPRIDVRKPATVVGPAVPEAAPALNVGHARQSGGPTWPCRASPGAIAANGGTRAEPRAV